MGWTLFFTEAGNYLCSFLILIIFVVAKRETDMNSSVSMKSTITVATEPVEDISF
ncbi:hypothetical protein BKA82DRAFT_995885 [Pisolithus tinctorius]|uniref:Uncharacterized protein n=1 Tax=Pisolithus tinctorius Marx 270 TaxID=870435 RepID=A0A0C3JL96_PISTI|nr:hypothetical protein BKA82DRAFT_995885 [Pisolithus tinctorius]KIO09893.1 hypothetical protein M404DRAFT_995885 [Pisolithus tinctorius Marx 270]